MVHAVEPLARNIETIRRRALSNVRAVHGSLGNTSCYIVPRRGPNAAGQMFNPHRIHHTVTNVSAAQGVFRSSMFRQYTLDELLRTEHTALIHLDVEGTELQALQGGEALLARDRPVVTTEVTVHQDQELSRAVLSHMAARGYDSYLVEDVCGGRMDCRNVIHLPRHRAASLMQAPAAGIARAAHRLLAVDATNVTQYAYPCCVRGGECCPNGQRSECCTTESVALWLHKRGRSSLSGSREEPLNPPVYKSAREGGGRNMGAGSAG